MKIFALFLSTYILFLITLPCKDGDNCANDLHTGPISQNHNSDIPDHADGCSPFCVCSCCNVTVVVNSFHFDSTPFEIPYQANIPLKQDFISNYIPHFWQPPKIG